MNHHNRSDLRELFEPRTIAVVGASPDFSKGGNRPLRFLRQHGFCGEVYAVNPKYDQIDGIECYPGVLDIPGPVDTVMITVPEPLVVGVLKDCAKKGVKLAVIRTAFNFSDPTENQKMGSFFFSLRNCGLRIIGPNSVGFVNVHRNIAAYFHVCLSMKRLIPGRVGLVSQSGGLSGVLFNKIQDQNVGFSYVFSTGIEEDLELADFVQFLVEDPQTNVIACFVEGFRDPQKILTTFGKALEVNKPVILMKIGRSELGVKAAVSHTGKMVGKDDIWNAIFRQKGVIRVETLEELKETTCFFAKCKKTQRGNIGIFAASGGSVTISADQVGLKGLTLPHLSEETLTDLQKILPKYASIRNPLDASPVGDERYLQCLEIFSGDKNIDMILLPLTIVVEGFGASRARQIVQLQKSIQKPVIVLWLGGSLVQEGMRIIEESEIPIFRTEDVCIKALRSFVSYLKFQTSPQIPTTLNCGRIGIPAPEPWKSKDIVLDKSIFERFGIPIAKEGIAHSMMEALDLASRIGYPVALKVISPQLIHKTEAGAVRLHIRSDEELKEHYLKILESLNGLDPRPEIWGLLIQEMVSDGAEVLLGMYRDEEIGPVLTCSLGGVFVELIKDMAIRLPPLNYSGAKEMIEELKGVDALRGFRAKKRLDIDALTDAIVKFSQMIIALNGKVAEMEVNPLIVLEEGKGVKIVDSRIVPRSERCPASG